MTLKTFPNGRCGFGSWKTTDVQKISPTNFATK